MPFLCGSGAVTGALLSAIREFLWGFGGSGCGGWDLT